jgi:transcriptional regulator GlxA family with amidase domain
MPRNRDQGTGEASGRIRFDFVIVQRFPLLSLTLGIEALRLANREWGGAVFEARVLSAGGQPVESSSGRRFPADAPLEDSGSCANVLLLASYQPEAAITPGLIAWLRRQDRRGARLFGIDVGAMVLARAGLLAGHPVAVHHEVAHAFAEDFAGCRLTPDSYTLEKTRGTSVGGVASLDLILALLAEAKGKGLAAGVARVLNYAWDAVTARSAAPTAGPVLAGLDPALGRLVALMAESLEEPRPLAELGRLAGLPSWRARRLFARHLGTTPRAYYLRLRLERARQLLSYTRRPVAEVALAVGFSDTAGFSHAYKRTYGVSPSRDRWDPAGVPLHSG